MISAVNHSVGVGRPESRQVDTSLKILLVDDSASMLRIVGRLLDQCGFTNVELANDGASALEKLRAGRFDLVLSDVEMNPMSGLDVLRAARGLGLLGDTCFVLMTALKDTETVLSAKRLGADGFLLKPFSANALMETISRLEKLQDRI